MEKRILIAFDLSFGVRYGFRALYTPASPSPAPEVTAPSAAAEAARQDAVEAPRVVIETAPPPLGSTLQAEGIEDASIDNSLYTATLSNQGAVLKSFQLKAYSDAEGKAIELIDAASAAAVGWPLALFTGDTA